MKALKNIIWTISFLTCSRACFGLASVRAELDDHSERRKMLGSQQLSAPHSVAGSYQYVVKTCERQGILFPYITRDVAALVI